MYNDASAAASGRAHPGGGPARERRAWRDLAAGTAAGAAGAASGGPARAAPGRLDRRPADRAAGAERREQRAEARLRPGAPRSGRAGSTGWACAARLLPEVVAPGTPLGPFVREHGRRARAGAGCTRRRRHHRRLRLVPGDRAPTAGRRGHRARHHADAQAALGRPVFSPEHGVYSHRLGDRWLVGGASNSGGKALLRYLQRRAHGRADAAAAPRPADRPALAPAARAAASGSRWPTRR